MPADVRAELMDLQPASEWVVRLAACGLVSRSEFGGSNVLSRSPGRIVTSGNDATGGEEREGVIVAHVKLDEPELGTR